MKKITNELLDELTKKAQNSPRKRMNYNFHEPMNETLHRMLNAIEPESYIQPHKHESPDKAESFVVLRGEVLSVIFDNQGHITDHALLSAKNGPFGIDIPARIWHTLIALKPGSIIYESKDGPWQQANDKNFAPWAPTEGQNGNMEYMEKLKKTLL